MAFSSIVARTYYLLRRFASRFKSMVLVYVIYIVMTFCANFFLGWHCLIIMIRDCLIIMIRDCLIIMIRDCLIIMIRYYHRHHLLRSQRFIYEFVNICNLKCCVFIQII